MISSKLIRQSIVTFSSSIIFIAAQAAFSANVKVTPLGSHDGEFCKFDRAMIFEDPDGTRILYDAGRTVAGSDDPRLGKIDVILVSHMHGDHLGDRHTKAINAGSCDNPDISVSDVPNSNSVNIALAKKSLIITGSEMPSFFAKKLAALGGDAGNSQLVRFGGSKHVGGVTLTTVPAVHSNGIDGAMIGGDLGHMLDAAGLTAYAGAPTGYVLTFSNGLVVYLSGDTGITAEQKSVVHDYYAAKLAVINIGDTYTTGPVEAAHVINDMVQPASVIPSHANQESTKAGKVVADSKTAQFIKASRVPVHLPLSGHTMQFDKSGDCVAGC